MRAILLCCLLCCLVQGMAQIQPQLTFGATRETGQLMRHHITERLVPHPFVRLGLPIELPKSKVVVFAQTGWQHWRATDVKLRYLEPVVRESLILDNLQIGVGFDWHMRTNYKLQPVLAILCTAGFALRSEYKLQDSNIPGVPTEQFVNGGTLPAAGWQMQPGLQYAVGKKSWIYLRFMLGTQGQDFFFTGITANPSGTMLSGIYTGWSVGFTRQLGNTGLEEE